MTAVKPVKKRKKAKKPALSAAEKALLKLQQDHRRAVRSSFRFAGFERLAGVSDKEFEYQGQKSDFDDVFIFENVIILAEYTCANASGVGAHLKNKKHIYDKILADTGAFIDFLKLRFPKTEKELTTDYHKSKLVVKIVYCSRHDFDESYKMKVPGPIYMDYPAVRYFLSVGEAIKMSSRYDLFHFLDIEPSKVGSNGKIDISVGSDDYSGLILPEAHSHFEDGFKVITFYADPESLLRTCYVLRKDGWRDSLNLYQRMISKAKIDEIRSYLKKKRRVFINNIIVTLPSSVKPIDMEGNTIKTKELTEMAPVTIKLPDRPNTVGIIDGQHRVFAYHETSDDDSDIAKLRIQQNLLVTGVIYPEKLSPADKEKFEARLFLEINSNQSNAKSQLKQAIGLVLDPFAPESIAAKVLALLAKSGPLTGYIEQYFFDTNKLKTASIVSYGLKPLVKTSGKDSLFSIWKHDEKEDVEAGKDDAALEEYAKFCAQCINIVLIAIKRNLARDRWTTDPKTPKRVLATTYINSFLITTRMLVEKGVALDPVVLEASFDGIDKLDFSKYHSSQYNRMAEEIVKKHFK